MELLDELLEGDVLVGIGAEGDVADASEGLAEGGVAAEVGAQSEGVDEEADEVLDFEAVAAGDGRADDDVGLPE